MERNYPHLLLLDAVLTLASSWTAGIGKKGIWTAAIGAMDFEPGDFPTPGCKIEISHKKIGRYHNINIDQIKQYSEKHTPIWI